MNVRHPMAVLHWFSIKNIFYDKIDLSLFCFYVTISKITYMIRMNVRVQASEDHESDHWSYIFNPLWGLLKRCILHYFGCDTPVYCVNISVVYSFVEKWIYHRQRAYRYQRIYQNYQWDFRRCISDQMWVIHLIWFLQTRYYHEQKTHIWPKLTTFNSVQILHMGFFPIVIVKWGNTTLITSSSYFFNTWVCYFLVLGLVSGSRK